MTDARVTTAQSPAQRVVFLVPDGVHLLDLAGPAQVFSSVAAHTGTPWRLDYVAESEVVTSAQGVPLIATVDLPRTDAGDLVVVVGRRVGSSRVPDAFAHATLDWLRAHHAGGGTVVSVCSGAFALADAGLLDGRRATTHHDLLDALGTRSPRVRVVRDVLFVSDDRVHTSAGIASGIDLALHLVADRLGTRVASRIARGMVVAARRNGDEPQESVMLRMRDHMDDVVHRTQDVIDDRFTERLPLALLAREVAASPRTLTRAFTRALGLTPLRYQHLLRVEHAERLIGAGQSVEAAARLVGFDDARMLRTLRSRATH